MSFDQTTIQDVTAGRVDAELRVSWRSYAPGGTTFQVYLSGMLAWAGSERSCVLPYPGPGPEGRQVRVDVGVVAPGEDAADFSAGLPAVPGGGQRVSLGWLGGAFLDPSIAGFHVYQGTSPGGAVDYSAPVGTVTAYPLGIVLDGYGVGGYGLGGYGSAASSYSWTSKPLASGTWNFAVKAFRAAGDEGPAATVSATVTGPPRPPARDANGARAGYQLKHGPPGGYGSGPYGDGGYGTGGYGFGGYGEGAYGAAAGDGPPYATISWQASPGY